MSDVPSAMTPVYRAIAEIPKGPSVIAIGNFDGVHLGTGRF